MCTALGIRQKVEHIMANVFYSTFLNVFYSCHVFTFFNVFLFFLERFLHLWFAAAAGDDDDDDKADSDAVTVCLVLEIS